MVNVTSSKQDFDEVFEQIIRQQSALKKLFLIDIFFLQSRKARKN